MRRGEEEDDKERRRRMERENLQKENDGKVRGEDR